MEEIRAQQEADLARLEAERDAARAAQQLEGLRLRQFLDQQVLFPINISRKTSTAPDW